MRTTKASSLSLSVYCLGVFCLAVAGIWLSIASDPVSAQIAKSDQNVKSISNRSNTDNLGGGIPGTGTGAIPDRGATGCGEPRGPALDISFDGSGLSGTVASMQPTVGSVI